jgi:hypothetical protein
MMRHIGSSCKHSGSYVMGLQEIMQLEPRSIQLSTTPAYPPPDNTCAAAASPRNSPSLLARPFYQCMNFTTRTENDDMTFYPPKN